MFRAIPLDVAIDPIENATNKLSGLGWTVLGVLGVLAVAALVAIILIIKKNGKK